MGWTELKRELEKDLSDYKSIPFWSWNNELDEQELVRQAEWMHEVGIGGFIIHARTGLKTEYLGKKWFSCVEACLDAAKRLGMRAWIYDDNGWPSGFAGGLLLKKEEYRAQYLEYKTLPFFDRAAFAVFKAENGGYVRIKSERKDEAAYHTVYLRTSPSNTDILNPEVTEAFINFTHERYYSRFGSRFGKEFVGFFTDEPQYYRWAAPYSRTAEREYRALYGEDLKDGLIYLFVQSEKGYPFRVRYYTLLNRLYTENYYKRLYNWCEAHNCKLTGHSVEEGSLHGQMWGGAGVMPTYEYEHIPTIDWLGRTCGNLLAPLQVASASAQLGKKRVLTETFGCAGYDVNYRELKHIAEYQYFCGVNMMCQHLVPYSVAGQGKIDHPPVFSAHTGSQRAFAVFNDYFTKLGFIVANTSANVDAAVLLPMQSAYLDYVREDDGESIRSLEEDLENLLAFLNKNGVTYELLDETLLAKYGKAEKNVLTVGNSSYKTVILPKLKSVAGATLKLLQEFCGRLLVSAPVGYIDGKRADARLLSNCSLNDIVNGRRVRARVTEGKCFVTSRSGVFGEFIFVKNLSGKRAAKVEIDGLSAEYVKAEIGTLSVAPAEDEILLRAGEGCVFIKDVPLKNERIKRFSEDKTDEFSVVKTTENYLLLDHAEVGFDGEIFSRERPLPDIAEELLRMDYKGTVWVRHNFFAKEKMPLKLFAEKSDFLKLTLNGKSLKRTQSAFDVNFFESDLTPYVNEGKNEIIYELKYFQHEGVHFALFDPRATESLRNCLYYDTALENMYVAGDFRVGEDRALYKTKGRPQKFGDLTAEGFPFFKGTFTLAGGYRWNGREKIFLRLSGRYAAAEAKINGRTCAFVLREEMEITELLKIGDNVIEIEVISGLRNFFGPHHFAPEVEPTGVSPYCFTMRGSWKNGRSPDYTEHYNTMPFGMKKIEFIKC